MIVLCYEFVTFTGSVTFICNIFLSVVKLTNTKTCVPIIIVVKIFCVC